MKVAKEHQIYFSNICRKRNTCDNCGGHDLVLMEDYAQLGHSEDVREPILALIHKCLHCHNVRLFVVD